MLLLVELFNLFCCKSDFTEIAVCFLLCIWHPCIQFCKQISALSYKGLEVPLKLYVPVMMLLLLSSAVLQFFLFCWLVFACISLLLLCTIVTG